MLNKGHSRFWFYFVKYTIFIAACTQPSARHPGATHGDVSPWARGLQAGPQLLDTRPPHSPTSHSTRGM